MHFLPKRCGEGCLDGTGGWSLRLILWCQDPYPSRNGCLPVSNAKIHVAKSSHTHLQPPVTGYMQTFCFFLKMAGVNIGRNN